jgi:hypothetical protein
MLLMLLMLLMFDLGWVTCPFKRWNPLADHHLQRLRLPAISYHVTLHRFVLLRRPRMVIHLEPYLDRPLLVQGM